MAPVAPSPPRFLGRRPRSTPTAPVPSNERQPASTRPSQANDYATDNDDERRSSTARQFASAPRFSTRRAKAPAASDAGPPSPPRPALLTALRAPAHQREIIEDDAPPSNDSDEEMLEFDGDVQILPSIEHIGQLQATGRQPEQDEPTHELPYSPKRRRLDSGAVDGDAALITNASTTPRFKMPQAPASRLSALQYFSLLSPAPAGAMHPVEQIASQDQSHRPPFFRPSTAHIDSSSSSSILFNQQLHHASSLINPLPEAFSPHRRGQRFIPGGMAATVQSWILETGQAAIAQRRQSYSSREDFAMKIMVEELNGEGAHGAMVKAKRFGGGGEESVDVLLTRQGNGGTVAQRTGFSDGGGLKVGTMIGVRAPTWDTTIDGWKWIVAVDWKVMN